jgi:putative transposase
VGRLFPEPLEAHPQGAAAARRQFLFTGLDRVILNLRELVDEPRFFNPWSDIRHTQNRLPHWQQSGATYFVTFHMADAIPAHLRESHCEQRDAWLEHHPEPWDEATEHEYHRRFSGAVEHWLDAAHGSCALRSGEAAAIVAECLGHFDAVRYVQQAWVVMPNHVHVLVSLHADFSLEQVLHTWKSFTSHRLRTNAGTPQPFWQADYFDRLVRDETHFANCVRYIRRNPPKARLRTGEFVLFESELAKSIE